MPFQAVFSGANGELKGCSSLCSSCRGRSNSKSQRCKTSSNYNSTYIDKLIEKTFNDTNDHYPSDWRLKKNGRTSIETCWNLPLGPWFSSHAPPYRLDLTWAGGTRQHYGAGVGLDQMYNELILRIMGPQGHHLEAWWVSVWGTYKIYIMLHNAMGCIYIYGMYMS